ncbi:hypothetical protein VQ02_07385 [Methylobacterium variabile]|uniref:Uncharacterized protein n=1 Tax=Methylobacterium variabile TaxID=298794 RepID=A0A0J6SZN9_9HYPH|nr:hypothetical protein [Methylobacterium variabile]KMO40655.1 hypothetical protein VQ02_07385 [Methylobacterium variabile]
MTVTLEDLLTLIQKNPDILNQLQTLANQGQTPIQGPPSVNHGRACPLLSTLALAQVTFFDNGIHRAKNKPEFAFTFELWSGDTSTLKLNRPTWKKSFPLVHYDRFKSKIDGLKDRGSISEEFHNSLITAYQHIEPEPNQDTTVFLGLAADKTPGVGTAFIDGHFVYAVVKNRRPTYLEFIVNDQSLSFTRFSTTDLKGNLLKQNAEVQARNDLTGKFYDNWPT